MKQEKQTEIETLIDGEQQETIGMSLDLDSANMLMQMLSKNLYSDGIGSSIRETASNALDSHRRAGVDKPIVVSFIKTKEHNYEFTVEDFGLGLDADDVEQIISKYGKSTKRESNVELGMFGLGFKAPLAYSSSFYFICRKDGVERKYMMYEGDDYNKIDLLYEQKTKEGNGVKIIIPSKYEDRWEFIKKIKEQLAYFEGVYFNMHNVGDDIDNNFKIHRNDVFQRSELSSDNNMHLCLDNVYYPIDFNKLGIRSLRYPIGLRFSLTDGLFPTPNREAIRYTKESKKAILDKLGEFAEYMIGVYNKSFTLSEDIKAIFKYYNSNSRYVKVAEKSYEISELLKYGTTKLIVPKLKGIPNLDLKALAKNSQMIFNEYKCKYILENDRFSQTKASWNSHMTANSFDNYAKIFIYEERIGANKKAYIKSLHGYLQRIAFIKKTSEFTLKKKKSITNTNRYYHDNDYDNYYDILNLKNHKKKLWRTVIDEFKHVQELFLKDVENFDDVIIPQTWLDARKKKKASTNGTGTGGARRLKLVGEINCKKAEDLLRYVDGKNAKFTPHIYKLEKINTLPALVIYGKQEEQLKLDKLYHISKKQKMRFIVLSQRERNVVDKIEIHNLMSIEKYMEGKSKPFKRIATAAIISKLMNEYNNVFRNMSPLLHVCKSLHDKLKALSDYKYNQIDVRNTAVYDAIIEVADAHKLYDETIYPEYLECKAILEKLTFLNPTMGVMSNYYSSDDPMLDVLTDLFKYYKYKVNFDRYHMRLNEDLPLDEILTEETVEELTKTN